MLAKTHRLTRAEFSAVFARPHKRQHTAEYSLYCTTSLDFKVAVVVGKKVAKEAVVRNRLRREVYGALQHQFRSTPEITGAYLIILKPPYGKHTKSERQTIIKSLLAQITRVR
jgi:ribonuclease P protein component